MRRETRLLNSAWLHGNVASSRDQSTLFYLFLSSFLFLFSMLYLLMPISGTVMPTMMLYYPDFSLRFPSPGSSCVIAAIFGTSSSGVRFSS
jgi:hypothetical protein